MMEVFLCYVKVCELFLVDKRLVIQITVILVKIFLMTSEMSSL